MTTPDGAAHDDSPSHPADDDLSPIGLLALLLRRRRLIGYCAALSFALFAGVKLLLPRTYTASSIFMPQTRSTLPNLSGIAAQFGLAVPGTDPSQSPAFYSSLAKTREILAKVAAGRYTTGVGAAATTLPLADILKIDAPDDSLRRLRVIEKLEKMVTTDVSLTTGVVTLEVTSRYPALSEQVNRRVIELLNTFNIETRKSRATQERQFTESRIIQVGAELRQAEDRLQGFLQRNRDYRNSPDLVFQQERLAREVAMRQQVFTTLAQAAEQAKIEEVRDTPVITIVDAPEAPVVPDPRGLAQTALLSVIGGAVLGTLLALMRESAAAGVAGRDRRWIEVTALARASIARVRRPFGSRSDV